MKKITTLALGLMLASTAFAQKANSAAQIPTFQETMGKYFLVGAAINTDLPNGQDPAGEAVVKKQFNQVVAENCMKGEKNHPEVNRFDFTDGDKLADWAEKNGKTLIGHCLVWHSQPPKWMFTDDKGNLVSREVLIGRMYNHIMNVVTHYKGRVKGWDVVNEAFEDDGSYRKSLYYKIIGPEFIELAFRFAHEADPNVELYYNDYSTSKPAKREAICKLVRDLKAKGLRIDAVGMQSHNGFDYPDYAEYEKSIEAFAGEGVKVMLTELDMNMLPNPEGFGGAEISQKFELQKKYNPYVKGLNKKAQKLFNQRYLDLFKIVDHDGKVVYEGPTDSEQVIPYKSAFLMQQLLQGGMKEPGGTSQSLWGYVGNYRDTEFGGKTGTTNNHSDAWFMCVSPKLVVGAWVGGEYRCLHFRTGALGQGSRTALPVCGYFLQSVFGDPAFQQYHGKFDKPEDSDITRDMYICASYAPKPKVDTTRVDSTAFQEEIVLDDEGNPIIREVPAKKAEGESATGTATTEEKKEKKKAKPTEQPVNFDDL